MYSKIAKLIEAANLLDSLGEVKLANQLDAVIKKAVSILPEVITPWDSEHPDLMVEKHYEPKIYERVKTPMSNLSKEMHYSPEEAIEILMSSRNFTPEEKRAKRAEIQSAASRIQELANSIAIKAAPTDQTLAEDIVMHIMEKVLTVNIAPASIIPWTKMVAKNYVIDHYRNRSKEINLSPEAFSNRMKSGLPSPEELSISKNYSDFEIDNFKKLKEKILSELDTSQSKDRAGTIRQLEDWSYLDKDYPGKDFPRGSSSKNKIDTQISRARKALEAKIKDLYEAGEITDLEKGALDEWASSFRQRNKK